MNCKFDGTVAIVVQNRKYGDLILLKIIKITCGIPHSRSQTCIITYFEQLTFDPTPSLAFFI
jgi:hypothetical protein